MKNEKFWKEKLSAEEYNILREKGTEMAFTGKYYNFFENGIYVCKGCGNKLFHSTTKFHSFCGWPSFDQSIEGAIAYHQDNSFNMQRIEVTCAQCNGHLGHIFNDGPVETTGKRYCINSLSLDFIAEKETKLL